MAELLKDWIKIDEIERLGTELAKTAPDFGVRAFVDEVVSVDFEAASLTQRLTKITVAMYNHLPKDYQTALSHLDQVVHKFDDGLFGTVFPKYVEYYGLDEANLEASLLRLKAYTRYSTSEFAVRPFIEKYEARLLTELSTWATDENEHIRRLASEGIRPALPWGMALKKYKADPTPILPILDLLKADPALYVRKSVANNLNDISKTHPELVLDLAQNWLGADKHTDWIIKHALRTLLKKGNPQALSLFGYQTGTSVTITDFAISTPKVKIGEGLDFAFTLHAPAPEKIRLEYAIDYVKSTGKTSKKVFKISELVLPAGARTYKKSHAFKDLTTRKHYPGAHALVLLINGEAQSELTFEVVE